MYVGASSRSAALDLSASHRRKKEQVNKTWREAEVAAKDRVAWRRWTDALSHSPRGGKGKMMKMMAKICSDTPDRK